MSDYIERQKAIDAVRETFKRIPTTAIRAMDTIKALPSADVVQVEELKAEIYKLKCQQDSKNQDYYTGYMSALSTVEGIIAEMGEE